MKVMPTLLDVGLKPCTRRAIIAAAFPSASRPVAGGYINLSGPSVAIPPGDQRKNIGTEPKGVMLNIQTDIVA